MFTDESMLILYDNGNGLVYKEICEWLKSTNQQLQLAGALAMGNFARGGMKTSFKYNIFYDFHSLDRMSTLNNDNDINKYEDKQI